MTPEVSRRIGRALLVADMAATMEERHTLAAVLPSITTWDDLSPEWQQKIEAWEKL